MALPKISQPTYIFDSESKGQIEFRPYTVGEEKILLSVSESKDPKFIATNIKKVIQACILTPNVSVSDLFSYDIEMLLLKIRSKSAGEIINAKFTQEDGTKVDIEIDLDKVYVDHDPNHASKIKLSGDKIILVMKDPSFDQILSYHSHENPVEIAFDLLVDCVSAIYDSTDDSTYTVGDNTTKEEVADFINSLIGETSKLMTFLNTLPVVSYDLELPNGEKHKIKGVSNFFS